MSEKLENNVPRATIERDDKLKGFSEFTWKELDQLIIDVKYYAISFVKGCTTVVKGKCRAALNGDCEIVNNESEKIRKEQEINVFVKENETVTKIFCYMIPRGEDFKCNLCEPKKVVNTCEYDGQLYDITAPEETAES